jgi:hypothetical protein
LHSEARKERINMSKKSTNSKTPVKPMMPMMKKDMPMKDMPKKMMGKTNCK